MDNPQSDQMSLCVSSNELVALSAKLKKVQHVKHLSISIQDPLTEESARNLETGILKNRSLKHLKLAFQNVEPGVLKLLVAASARNPCLLTLDLSQTPFPTSEASSPSPSSASLELSGLTFPALNLKRLNLSRCKLPEHEFGAIASCLALSSSSLIFLDMSGNKMSVPAALTLSQALATNTTLETLKIRDCALGDAGAEAFASCLAKTATLDHLNISSNGIGPAGAKALAQSIEQNKSLGSLNLSHNPLLHSGLQAVIEAISKGDNLREVDFGFTQFEAATWSLLSQSINTWSKLWKISLSGNMHYRKQATLQSPSSSAASITKLTSSNSSDGSSTESNDSLLLSPATSSDMLRAPSPLRRVTAAKRAALLDQSEYAKSLEELCSALQVNSQVSTLDLSHNSLGDIGCKVLGSLLSMNPSLVDLKLKRCEITMKGVETVSLATSSNPASSLSFVDLTGNEADSLGTLGMSIQKKRVQKSLAWRPIRSHPIVQTRPHAEFTSLCPVPATHEVWVACTDGHVHFWPVSDFDNYDDVMSYVDVHPNDVPVTRRRINAMVACRATVWVLTDQSTIIVISQAKPHRIYNLAPNNSLQNDQATATNNACITTGSERLCMTIVDHDNQIAVIGGGSGDISLWRTAAGEEAMVTRKVLGSGFPIVAVAATHTLIIAGLVMPGRHSSIVVVMDHALEELYRQEVGTSSLISIVCINNLVITAFQDGATKLWHCDSREMVLVRSSAHIPPVSIQQLPSNSSYFISASTRQKNLCIWNPTSLTPVCNLDTPLPIKALALSGPYMAVLTEDEQVSLWMN